MCMHVYVCVCCVVMRLRELGVLVVAIKYKLVVFCVSFQLSGQENGLDEMVYCNLFVSKTTPPRWVVIKKFAWSSALRLLCLPGKSMNWRRDKEGWVLVVCNINEEENSEVFLDYRRDYLGRIQV